MSRAKKAIIVNEPDCSHICSKEADLGKLSARIENNENSLKDIKGSITETANHHEIDRKETERHFTDVATQLTKLNSAVDNLANAITKMNSDQERFSSQIQDLILSHQNMTNMQSSIDSRITQAQDRSDQRYSKLKDRMEAQEKRLAKLEQHKNTLFGICAFIVSLFTFIGLLAQIYQSFHK